jgi:hypothetical protein
MSLAHRSLIAVYLRREWLFLYSPVTISIDKRERRYSSVLSQSPLYLAIILWTIIIIITIFIYFPFFSSRNSMALAQSAWREIAEAKQLESIETQSKLELVCASEGTLSRWSRLQLQSFIPTPVSRRVDVRQAAGHKNNCWIFITTWWKTCCTLSGIRIGKWRDFSQPNLQYKVSI